MSLTGKIVADTGIKSSAARFHDVFSARPHHTANVSPEKVQACEIHDGEWGSAGSTIFWNYVEKGKAKVIKEIIETIDDEKNLTVLKVIEGDVLEEFKNFKIIIAVEAKPEGGSVVHWTMEFEKLKADVTDPTAFLELAVHLSKDIDEHLQETPMI